MFASRKFTPLPHVSFQVIGKDIWVIINPNKHVLLSEALGDADFHIAVALLVEGAQGSTLEAKLWTVLTNQQLVPYKFVRPYMRMNDDNQAKAIIIIKAKTLTEYRFIFGDGGVLLWSEITKVKHYEPFFTALGENCPQSKTSLRNIADILQPTAVNGIIWLATDNQRAAAKATLAATRAQHAAAAAAAAPVAPVPVAAPVPPPPAIVLPVIHAHFDPKTILYSFYSTTLQNGQFVMTPLTLAPELPLETLQRMLKVAGIYFKPSANKDELFTKIYYITCQYKLLPLVSVAPENFNLLESIQAGVEANRVVVRANFIPVHGVNTTSSIKRNKPNLERVLFALRVPYSADYPVQVLRYLLDWWKDTYHFNNRHQVGTRQTVYTLPPVAAPPAAAMPMTMTMPVRSVAPLAAMPMPMPMPVHSAAPLPMPVATMPMPMPVRSVALLAAMPMPMPVRSVAPPAAAMSMPMPVRAVPTAVSAASVRNMTVKVEG